MLLLSYLGRVLWAARLRQGKVTMGRSPRHMGSIRHVGIGNEGHWEGWGCVGREGLRAPGSPGRGEGLEVPEGRGGGWRGTCWRRQAADRAAAAPGERVCPNKPPLPPSFPASRLDGSVLRLSPRPHNRAPALMRLPNCGILTKGLAAASYKKKCLSPPGRAATRSGHSSVGGGCLPCSGIEPAICSRTDGQTDGLPAPALPLRAELSSPAQEGKLSADPNIAAAAGRRSQNS